MYISLVDALYSDVKTFSFGIATASGAALYSAYLTGSRLLALCAIAITAVGLARTLHILLYRKGRVEITTLAAARRWEFAYTTGANTYVLLLGLWGLAAFGFTQSWAAQFLSLTIALGNIVGIMGRNFANGRFFDIQNLCLGLPFMAGLALAGGPEHLVLAVLMVVFFLSAKRIAARFREMLRRAVIAQRDMSQLAARFDTAINNMPHGLAMFDADGRLAVINAHWSEVLPSDPGCLTAGARLETVLAGAVASGALGQGGAARLIDLAHRAQRQAAGKADKIEVENEGRHVCVTVQPMGSGGLVLVTEDVSVQRSTEARIAHMAVHDALTGLPNRALFQDRLEAALAARAEAEMLAILFVDLDNFKQINDTLGHPIGDTLLIEVADRLRFVVGEAGLVARFGSDEFVVLQSGARSAGEVAFLARRIIDAVSDLVQVSGLPVACSASVGIALAPRDGTDRDQLLKSADMALYRAKAGGKGGFHFFEEEMDRQARVRRETEMDLRQAIQNDELAVYFQPSLNLKTLTINACEALVRWPHPTRGMISPAEFIPIAEETGLVVEIGRQVLRKACLACADWPGHVRVAVNLSTVQFERDDVVALVEETLRQTGLEPDRLELEITETLLLQDSSVILDVLGRLRAMGVRIALDDFGTGYSSLSYLHKFPLHKVKIDRSFVKAVETDPRAVRLLHGIARLGADLGLSVTVEGVETQEQLQIVDEPGVVTEIQGFLLSPAVPDEQIRRMLDRKGPQLLRKVA